MGKHYRVGLALLLGALFILVCFSYMLNIETEFPSVADTEQDVREVVHFGVISRYSPKQIIQGYQPLMDYLSDVTPYHFQLRLSRNYMETVQQLAEGKVEFASLGNFTYVHANKEHGVRCIAMPLNHLGTTDNYDAFVVLKDSPVQNLKDMHSRSLAMASRFSFSAWMARWLLKQDGVNIGDLSTYTHLDHHDQVAEKVLRGEYDAGMVKAVIAEKYQSAGLEVLFMSPPIPSVPLVAAAQVPNEKVEIVQQALLALREKIKAGEIQTDGWDTEIRHGYGPGADESYDYTRQILSDLDAWD